MNSLQNPSREFSVMPFWFWNDELTEAEILRQISEMDANGVHGFVIHPRVGLPRHLGWMSDGLLAFMRVAIEEARKRDMKVILYDEGMYPSGSSCGQVVQHDPTLACRCLAIEPLRADEQPVIQPGQTLIAQCQTISHGRVAIVDRPADAYIRGLHYINEGPAEDEPPAGDILNPKTAQLVLQLVHERFYNHFKDFFGSTVIGVFTDEPNPLGKIREKNVQPGTTGILKQVNRILGYDFTPHLPALWYDDEPDAQKYRKDYLRAVRLHMDQTWYAPLSSWCAAHNVALCGHPAEGDEIRTEKYFHIPGQDIVWRFIEPDQAKSVETPESTQGKVTSSAMIHLERRRNSNEFCGAYGNQTTYEEFEYLANWLLIRGVNLLIPHAFYYSFRGPRRDERPPDVGLNSKWWNKLHPFADHCRRLSWLNADSQHVCDLAILADPDHAPWAAAKACFEHQVDFNYLDWPTLLEKATVTPRGIEIASMRYTRVILDGASTPPDVLAALQPLATAGRVETYDGNAENLLRRLDEMGPRDVRCATPSPGLRFRHVHKDGRDYYLFFNEISNLLQTTLTLARTGHASWINSRTGRPERSAGDLKALPLKLKGFETSLLEIEAS